MSTAAPTWVERLVEAERSNPLSEDDDPSLRFSHLEVDDTWTDDDIAAFAAADRKAWRADNEAKRLSVEAAAEAARLAHRAKALRGNGLSPIEHGRIMREAARWKRFDNGRHCEGSDAPLLSASAREVLGHLVEYVNWMTRERDTTVEALRIRTGYRHEKTIRRALKALVALGLIVRLDGFHRVRVRLEFSNAQELRGLMMRAATRASAAPKRPAKAAGSASSSSKSPPPSGPRLSNSLLLGSVPDPRALLERAGVSGKLKTSRATSSLIACENENSRAADGGETLTASPGARGASPHAVPPMAAKLTTAPKAPGRDESQRTRGSTRHAGAQGASDTSKGSVGAFPTLDAFTSPSHAAANVLAMLEAIRPGDVMSPVSSAPRTAASSGPKCEPPPALQNLLAQLEAIDPRRSEAGERFLPRPNIPPPPLPRPPPSNVYDLRAQRAPARKRKRDDDPR